MTTLAYEQRKKRLIEVVRSNGGRLRLGKSTSNLFRDRKDVPVQRLDVRDFNNVLQVDRATGVIDVEGMTPYATLVAEALKHGLMPSVVPQLKSITIGGAVTGCGIESTSFRYGLVHETVEELEVLLPGGDTVVCTPTNQHRDLFYGFPNSYGTLGYALRVKVKALPVKPYVALTHIRYGEPAAFFAELRRRCDEKDVDFVDGTIFGRNEMYLTLGRLVDTAPYTSDYTYERIYYRSIRERETDYLTISDYLWRWDTDWFWCSKNLGAQNPLLRRLYGRKHLNSVTYTKIMRWNSRWGLTRRLNRLGVHAESVIQDVEIPIDNCVEFFDFYHDAVRFLPVWVCPTRAYREDAQFDLYRMDTRKLYVNFGFWDVIRSDTPQAPGFYNRQVERKVRELGGMKSLYSDSYFTPEEFWQIYQRDAYQRLKRKYDPTERSPDLYAKTVLKE
jgi:FAD/FMN-containing dehydrogenase